MTNQITVETPEEVALDHACRMAVAFGWTDHLHVIKVARAFTDFINGTDTAPVRSIGIIDGGKP